MCKRKITDNASDKTRDLYGFLWSKAKESVPIDSSHFNKMQEVISRDIVNGGIGIDAGSGCGHDTLCMAKANPFVRIVSLDISDGVYKTRQLTSGLKNVWIVKGSVLNMPFKDNIFDFAYSFGVLHHTIDPEGGLKEIKRIIKKDMPAYLYLYEDHSENRIKYVALEITSILRQLTTKIPKKILYLCACFASPLVVLCFSWPSRIFRRFKATRPLAEKMPFNFGTHLFSVRGDLYDRFAPPIERRFSRQEIYDIFNKGGFSGINVTKLKERAGWVIWGYKG